MLDDYKKHRARWDDYERWFLDVIADRQIEHRVSPTLLDNSVLLCSEAMPQQCHRRLVAEYLAERWDDVTIEHL